MKKISIFLSLGLFFVISAFSMGGFSRYTGPTVQELECKKSKVENLLSIAKDVDDSKKVGDVINILSFVVFGVSLLFDEPVERMFFLLLLIRYIFSHERELSFIDVGDNLVSCFNPNISEQVRLMRDHHLKFDSKGGPIVSRYAFYIERPLDLQSPRLLNLLRLNCTSPKNETILLYYIDHILSDEWRNKIFGRHLEAFLRILERGISKMTCGNGDYDKLKGSVLKKIQRALSLVPEDVRMEVEFLMEALNILKNDAVFIFDITGIPWIVETIYSRIKPYDDSEDYSLDY